jgi:fatty acid desaturase
MKHSLFPSDEALPTWLHSLLLLLVVSPFALFLFWHGFHAISTAQLDPLSGPEFGQFFFGSSPLQGKAARIAGCSLVALGGAFVALAVQFSRLLQGSSLLRWLPWALVALSVALSFGVRPPA